MWHNVFSDYNMVSLNISANRYYMLNLVGNVYQANEA